MASAIAMMIGGAVVNAFSFSGSNYLFSHIGKDDSEEEKERHDRAMEQLSKEQIEWEEKRSGRQDFLKKQKDEEQEVYQMYDDGDQSMKLYQYATSKNLHTLNDYYTPSESTQKREILFVVCGMALTGFVAWKIHKI